VDVDAFVARHSGEWRRLEELLSRRRLTGAEADELVLLYQRTATHLSVVRSSAPDPALVGQLSRLVARGEVRAGPGVNDQPDLGPLTRNGTVWRDGCHPTGDPLHPAPFKGSGAQLLGAQLVASFDSLPIDPP